MSSKVSSVAIDVPNDHVDLPGRRIAYRSIGVGRPLILCTRFRGTMDTWDPAFLDHLAAQGLRVITFDYTGLGLSSGQPSYSPLQLAQDPIELAAALHLEAPAIGGWSVGGMAAQVAMLMAPRRFTHGVLICTTPPGPISKKPDPLFARTATKPVNDEEDEVVLFFEPASAASRDAAALSHERIHRRTTGRSPEVPWAFANAALANAPKEAPFPSVPVLEMLKTTSTPILHLGGDHDIAFPVENWYALSGQLPTLQTLTFPVSGHGAQHQQPQASARYIGSFLDTTS